MRVDLEEGQTLHHSEVTQRFEDAVTDTEICVMNPGEEADKMHLIREMKQLGWSYLRTNLETGEMFFKDEDTE
jgi:hypothetical protein